MAKKSQTEAIFRHVPWGKRTEKCGKPMVSPGFFWFLSSWESHGKTAGCDPPGMAMLVYEATS